MEGAVLGIRVRRGRGKERAGKEEDKGKETRENNK